MSNQPRYGRNTGVVAAFFVALVFVLGAPATAGATPVRIGEFYFDLPDGFSPSVHVSNESGQAFQSFAIEFVNDVFPDVGVPFTDTQSVGYTDLQPGNAAQTAPTDLGPVNALVLPISAALNQFVYGPLGTITFSPDGGTTFLSAAVLDLALTDQSFGIFFEAAPVQTDPVPEPGTLLLIASGAAAAGLRRVRSKLRPRP